MPYPDKPKIVYKIIDRDEQEITFDDYAWTKITYDPARIIHRTEPLGKLYTYSKGFVFKFTIHWDKLTPGDYYKLVDLFDANIEYIKVYPRANEVYYEECVILQPVELQDYLLIWDTFELVFEGKRRVERVYLSYGSPGSDLYDPSSLDLWGTNRTTFADTTTRRGIVGGWNTVMNEQNNKDTATNNAINTLRNNINSHLTSSTAHNTLYYTKSEIDAKFKELIFVASTKNRTIPPSFKYFEVEPSIRLAIKGFRFTLDRICLCDGSGNSYIWDLSPQNYVFEAIDVLTLGMLPSYDDVNEVTRWRLVILKNDYWLDANFNIEGDYIDFIATIVIKQS